MVRAMFVSFIRRAGVLALAFGVFLGGAAPAGACSSPNGHAPRHVAVSLKVMPMHGDCATMAHKSQQTKQLPCKHHDGNCADCAACVSNAALNLQPIQIGTPENFALLPIPPNANLHGIAIPPGTPPPIALA